MLFSSLLFLWSFLPLVLLLVILSPRRWHNGWLLLASIFFYAWGGVSYTVVLLASILSNYGIGRLIDHWRYQSRMRWALVGGIAINLILLAIFKYANFAALNINGLLTFTSIPPFELPAIALPIGISFYTFQAISYLVDVYRGTSPVQRSLPKLGLFISFFPQLIAGPIVRYHYIAEQIEKRRLSWEKTSSGLRRFIGGLAKKVLLANNFAWLADEIFALDPSGMSVGIAWLGVLLYALQIYYDFSGYSDMAIGLGRMFGFELPENFNFPYLARSVREFWQRWHITLGAWFRDYLYIPLGGNRGRKLLVYRNLLIVFFLTGLWHGASWNFVIWGLWHGMFMMLERESWFPKLPAWAGVAYTLAVVLPAWVFFQSPDWAHAMGYFRAMLGLGEGGIPFDLAFYWNRELSLALLVGILGCTPWLLQIWQKIEHWAKARSYRQEWLGVLQSLSLIALFLYCSVLLVNNTYNPFIYFRF